MSVMKIDIKAKKKLPYYRKRLVALAYLHGRLAQNICNGSLG